MVITTLSNSGFKVYVFSIVSNVDLVVLGLFGEQGYCSDLIVHCLQNNNLRLQPPPRTVCEHINCLEKPRLLLRLCVSFGEVFSSGVRFVPFSSYYDKL